LGPFEKEKDLREQGLDHARRMVWRLVTRLERLGEWMEAWRPLPLRT